MMWDTTVFFSLSFDTLWFQNPQHSFVESWSSAGFPIRHQRCSWSSFRGGRPSSAVFADADDDEQYIKLENMSSGQVIELIELSLFQACFALSEGDVGPLKLFIVAVKTAAKKLEGAYVRHC
jgi:hypothetical protein